jgi:modulator of FtsH protease HflK
VPEVTRYRMYLETMKRIMSGTDKIIIDGKLGQSVVPPVSSAATDENSVAADCGQGGL